ncbi:uncharacterized protein LOC141720179 [Apium graveolens]|uniref:uncharacterized protein LOC141720179 n=1 Tax=Apium graveolens TaxID=4045 RepID=UPI003D78B357
MAGDQTPGDQPLPSPKIDTTSPFYLGTQDRPGDFITSTRLKGENYDKWADDIQLALEARRKIRFLDGSIKAPRCEAAWDTHQTRFALVNGPRIQQLKSSIAKCKQIKIMSVETYFGKLSTLWEELNHLEHLITCAYCSACTAGQQHEKRREASRLHQFLMGLCSKYYAHLRTNIFSQDPLRTLDRVF